MLILVRLFWAKKRGAKSNWIKTIILLATVHNFASKCHMCLLAAGRKGDNHDLINKMMLDELSTLSNGIMCLNKETKSLEPFSLHVVCDLMDWPERCKQNWVLSHTGNTTRRWGYSAFIDMKKLAPCDNCHAKNLKMIKDHNNDEAVNNKNMLNAAFLQILTMIDKLWKK